MTRIAIRRPVGALLALLATAACGDDSGGGPAPRPPEPNFVALQSDAGDYIGGGRSYRYTRADAILSVAVAGGQFGVQVSGDEEWGGTFQLPSPLARLQPGSWSGLTRWPFNSAATGGLSWSGEGRGCNTLRGSLTIDSLTWAADTLTSLDFRFEQHCEGAAPALRGTVHWRLADSTRPPGPVTPVPANLWRPPAGATPASGSFVYLQSDAGDYIGGGQTATHLAPATPISVVAEGGSVRVSVAGWWGEFEPMNSIPRLAPGYYAGVQRWPFHNPAKGGLSWSGNGRGCNTLTGWFAVDQVTWSGDAITALDLRFEQHCEGGTPALRGRVRWQA